MVGHLNYPKHLLRKNYPSKGKLGEFPSEGKFPSDAWFCLEISFPFPRNGLFPRKWRVSEKELLHLEGGKINLKPFIAWKDTKTS